MGIMGSMLLLFVGNEGSWLAKKHSQKHDKFLSFVFISVEVKFEISIASSEPNTYSAISFRG